MIITNATFGGLTGSTSNLSGFHFERCSFEEMQFSGNWQGCTFLWCDFTDCALDGADLRGAVFQGCNLKWVDVTDAIVDGETTFLDCSIDEVKGWNDLAVGCRIASAWIEA